jgi:hypothetical protein
LKLYARHQFERFEAPIDNTYTASAHSAETLISWYNQNKDVGDIAVASQILFPIFATVFVLLFLIFQSLNLSLTSVVNGYKMNLIARITRLKLKLKLDY